MVLSVVLVSIIFLLAPKLGLLLNEPGISDVLRVLLIAVIINALSRIQVAILLREHKFKALSFRGLIMAVAGGVSALAFALNGFGVWSLVAQQLVSSFVALTMLWSVTSWRPSLSFSQKAAKIMYRYASRYFVSEQVLFFTKRMDEVFITIFLGTTLLGYYSVAKRLLETLSDMLFSVLSRVTLSVYSKQQNDTRAIIKSAGEISHIMASLSFPLFLGAAIIHNELIIMLFTDKWADASVPFLILTISGVFC